MKINYFILGLLFASSCFLNAQSIDKKVLFTIDKKPFYTDEFLRVYNKNLDLVKDESQKDISNYLDLYVGYKLKVEKAYKDKLNDKISYQNEFKTHRDQLAKSYINDSEVTQSLLDEAYERYKKEVKASHILFELSPEASPADTLKVYQKAIEVRNKALKGESFDQLAKKYSSDPSAATNFGDLGYFSVFKMVYPFETAAFNTSVGEVSMPVRTSFGYHLIKVVNKRDNRGAATVRHIMIVDEKNGPKAEEQKINDIYAKILSGEDFSELAKQHSTDVSSATRGGLMAEFKSGDIAVEEFEEVSFGLKSVGDISKPFKTRLGWHIVKLENKKPIESFSEVKYYFEGRIARDSRSQKIQNALSVQAKNTYSISINDKNLADLIKVINPKNFNSDWTLDENNSLNTKPLVTINNDKVLNVNEFINFFTLKLKRGLNIKPISKFVNQSLEEFSEQHLIAYYDENLENRNIEFKNIVDEYRDGLLIFELLEKDIWNKAKSDTLALENYYEQNKQKYIDEKKYRAEIFSTTNKKIAKQTLKLLKKNKSADQIKQALNQGDTVNVISREDTFKINDPGFPKSIKDSKKINGVLSENGYFYVVNILEIVPEKQLNFDEALTRVISDYQQHLESNWVGDLKKEFEVKIDNTVFNDIKKALNKN